MGIDDRPGLVVEQLALGRLLDVTDLIDGGEVVQIALLHVQADLVSAHREIFRVDPRGGRDLLLQLGVVGVDIVMQHNVDLAQGAPRRCRRLVRQDACHGCGGRLLAQVRGNFEALQIDPGPGHELERADLGQALRLVGAKKSVLRDIFMNDAAELLELLQLRLGRRRCRLDQHIIGIGCVGPGQCGCRRAGSGRVERDAVDGDACHVSASSRLHKRSPVSL